MKKIYLLFLTILLISSALALTVKQGQAIQLTAVCDNCTYVNLTKVVYPNGSFALLGSYSMTKNDTNFNYSWNNTNTLGTYTYSTCGDLNGVVTCGDTLDRSFEVTPSGQSGTANIVFILLIIAIAYTLNLIGYFKGEITLTALTGMFLMFLGIYTINNGIIIFRDDITKYFSYLTIGWGFVSTFVATMNLIGE